MTTPATLSNLPTELVLASLAWLDNPRDLARCRSVSRAIHHLVDSHLPPLLAAVLRRSPLHASVPSPLPASLDALREMHLLRGRGGSAASPAAAPVAVASMLVVNGHPNQDATQAQVPVPCAPVSLLPPTAFVACSSRSYTDTVQIPGTPVLLCSTRTQSSPLAALHLSSLTQSPPSGTTSAAAYKVAIALPLPAHDAHAELVGTMAAHPSGRPLVATGSIDGTVKVWTAVRVDAEADAWTVQCVATFRHHRGWAAAVCLSNEWLVSSGPDNEVHVYALAGIEDAEGPVARIHVPIPTETPFGIFGASISPSGRHLVVMDLDGVAYLYQATAKGSGFELKCELSERLTLREARHFEANVRQSFGCLVQVTDHCVFVNSVRVGEVKVYDVWTGHVLYSLSIPTFNPPRSRTVHSFRYVAPSTPSSSACTAIAATSAGSTTRSAFAGNKAGFFGLLVTTCAGDLHCFDYSNASAAAALGAVPARWRIAPAIVAAPTTPAAASSSSAPVDEQEVEVEDDEFADMPALMSPSHLEDSHEFDFGSTPPASPQRAGARDAGNEGAIKAGSNRRGQLVVTPRGVRDHDLEMDVDESVAAHVWGLVV